MERDEFLRLYAHTLALMTPYIRFRTPMRVSGSTKRRSLRRHTQPCSCVLILYTTPYFNSRVCVPGERKDAIFEERTLRDGVTMLCAMAHVSA
ncbi:hypothetical protein BU24DRAFT_419386 [Aaosphaeria arxii CBS 175.79]|uniref:Uncharacterized protein n=1 Tax=Aaosphaeria arxii CBS 175.79 TaxID=1450172 RepID=A0A6A5Y5E6_9PLEO|nr:uncharacterized protein BU24DRAFT_419386 [Aaosphaeria arxii CBS 175.79]KAF2019764.1 hypothetical protein BU24DRAFT_419386 [Aaosphaeria arxii CBS 175.79]